VEKDGRFGSTFLKGGSLALTSFLLRYKPLQKEWQYLALTSFLLRYKPLQKEWQCLALTSL
jgi:hypothetical protein